MVNLSSIPYCTTDAGVLVFRLLWAERQRPGSPNGWVEVTGVRVRSLIHMLEGVPTPRYQDGLLAVRADGLRVWGGGDRLFRICVGDHVSERRELCSEM